MILKVLVGFVIFGVVYAAPSEIMYPGYDLMVHPKITTLFEKVCHIFQTVISSKISAVNIGVRLVEWVASNFSVIVMGAISAFGFCKWTDICSLNYEDYIPVDSLRSYATPERIETAENFLFTALAKYAENN